MATNSRTSKSIKNSVIAMGFYVVNLALQFFSRKIFLEYLGTEILGLNTTAMNLLQFLNLAELGISAGVSFTLYKPLHDKDLQTINEIITLQGQLYKRIACVVMVGAAILMCFFPLIFDRITIPIWYAYASFGVLLFSALLGYFVNYKQIILTASQQDYKVLYSFKSVMLIKVVAQMAAVYYFPNGYVYWLILEALFAIFASVSLNWMTRRTFPELVPVKIPFKTLRNKYPEFTLKIKQLFFHKIGGFALTQSSPIIIYAYTSLTVVALYGNYLIVISGISLLVQSIFNSMGAGIGDLVAEGGKNKILKVFFELFSVRFFIVVTLCVCTYILLPEFICLWIGKKYLLSPVSTLLIIGNLYIGIFRYTVESFINAYGLFRDIWAPIIEAMINVVLSILFGSVWGFNGVLLGVFISLVIMVVCWKPYFLFSTEFPGILKKYVYVYLKHIFAAILAIISTIYLWEKLSLNLSSNWSNFIIEASLLTLIFSIVFFAFLILFRTSLIDFLYRFNFFNQSINRNI